MNINILSAIKGFLIVLVFSSAIQAKQNSFDKQKLIDELNQKLQSHIVDSIETQIKSAEAIIIQKAYIKEMLEPYKDFGIDPENVAIYDSIKGIYESLRDDEDFNPKAEVRSKIEGMVRSKIYNSIIPKIIDKQSFEIAEQLQALTNNANKKIKQITDAYEGIAQISKDADDYETQVADIIRKVGFKGPITDVIEDMEVVFGAASEKYAKPMAILSALVDGVSSDDPTQKIEILFAMGSEFGGDIPLVGSIVAGLFDIGKELLAAVKRTGGLLERNFGQGCIASDGEYNQGTELKQSFYAMFPHIDRACPLSLSVSSGVYGNIYANVDNENELIFLYNGKWLATNIDETHAGASDIKALRIFLKKQGENAQANDITFLHSSYGKKMGFIHYKQKIQAGLNNINQLLAKVINPISYCDDDGKDDYLMHTLDLNWFSKLMKNNGGFTYDDAKLFSHYTVDTLLEQMLKNRYLNQHKLNLQHLDNIINNIKNNYPVRIHGKVLLNNRVVAGAKISSTKPFILKNNSCFNSETDNKGNYNIIVTIPENFRGNSDIVSASYRSNRESVNELLDIPRQNSYRIDIEFKDTLDDEKVIIDLMISPKSVSMKIGETQSFSVFAKYNNGETIDVTSLALGSSLFTATSVGRFSITTSYFGKTAAASIDVIDDSKPVKDSKDNCDDYPGTILVWDEDTQSSGCVCGDDKDWSDKLKKCATEQEIIVANTDCSAYGQFARAVWDSASNQVMCECLKGYEFDENNQCLADLIDKNCIDYPGTVYSNGFCECPGVLEWSEMRRRCVDIADLSPNDLDCTAYPGSFPQWDNSINGWRCECIGHKKWSPILNSCAHPEDELVASTDCSAQAGTIAIYDDYIGKVVCKCINSGLVLSSSKNACMDPQDAAVADLDCSHLGNAGISYFNSSTNKAACQCKSGYSLNQSGTSCESNAPIAGQGQQLPTPEIIKPGQCDVLYDKGSNKPESYVFKVDGYSKIELSYDTYGVKDNMSVLTSTRSELWRSGCVGTNGNATAIINLPAGAQEVIIDVHPNCAGTNSTGWKFKASCQ